MIILHTAGLLGRVISSSQGLYLNTGRHKHRINTYTDQTSMPCVGFEPAIPASERAMTVHALDRSVTVTGQYMTKLQTGRTGFDSRHRDEYFLFAIATRTALRPTSLLSNGFRVIFPWGYSSRGVKLATLMQLVPRLRMRGAIPLLSQKVPGNVLNTRRNNFTFTG
jgi:hypothetical protein